MRIKVMVRRNADEDKDIDKREEGKRSGGRKTRDWREDGEGSTYGW
jgi:hypothetical protein